jgi:hypothetical protein
VGQEPPDTPCDGDVLGTGAGALLGGAGALLDADAAPADPAAALAARLW